MIDYTPESAEYLMLGLRVILTFVFDNPVMSAFLLFFIIVLPLCVDYKTSTPEQAKE